MGWTEELIKERKEIIRIGTKRANKRELASHHDNMQKLNP